MAITARPPIAPDVAEVIGECAENVENRSLLLDKFVMHKSWPQVYLESTGETMRMDDASRWSFIRMAQNGEDFLRRELENGERLAHGRNARPDNQEKASIKVAVLRRFQRCACRSLPGKLSGQKLQQNRQFAQALAESPGLTAVVYGELQGRLIVNLSDSLIQNAGICLDRNTGLPYIHFRENGELSEFAEAVPEEERTLKGGVDFISAQPVTEPTIVVDISNVHYPEYYQTGEVASLANESPKPNTFPAVEKGVRYAFCIAANGMDDVDSDLFAKARSVLVEAITESGIGAKTGAGYGWFSDVTDEVEAGMKREAEAAEAIRVEEAKKKEEAERQANAKIEAERIAQLSPCERVLERWNGLPGAKSIMNGPDIAKFETRPDEEKIGIVEALRMPDGIGARIWAIIKGVSADDPKKKLRNPKAESDIRSYCKNTLKKGKMP